MARATTRTLLTLDRFFALVGMHPLTANQIGVTLNNVEYGCGHTLFQYGWQQSRIGREDIAQAISDAETRIADLLGYDVAPRWNKQDLRVVSAGMTSKTSRGYVISGGLEGKSLVEAAVTVTYNDLDSDGYNETASISVTTTVTDPQEIAVYYPGKSGEDAWEIRPINVSISGGIATVTFSRHQCVLEDLMDAPLNPDEVDGLVDGNFLETVDVYRHYLDPATQAKLMWEARDYCGECGAGNGACSACSYVIQNACLLVQDRRLGRVLLTPAEWDADETEFTSAIWSVQRAADRAQIYYRAGYYDPNLATPFLSMSPIFERIVANYALSLLPMPICDCGVANARYHEVAMDLADVENGRTIAFEQNPLGTTKGALDAWNLCKDICLGQKAVHA